MLILIHTEKNETREVYPLTCSKRYDTNNLIIEGCDRRRYLANITKFT